MDPCSWHFEHRTNESHVCGWICVCKVERGGWGAALVCALGGPGCSVCVCCDRVGCEGGGLFLFLGGNFFARLLYVHGGA